ncbi:penicillin acylase family protein [Pendulispora rubella]|uniref:Penicillin acylase family protein n=1 Tax=Pendulispora rubella TaxID=2741070 RepID=A0ABZ2KYX0_9BACT
MRSHWAPIAVGVVAYASSCDPRLDADPLSSDFDQPVAGDALSAYVVPGLARPVELVQDRWGVPHLFAESAPDVFLAQGFNAARERLFQIDLWRRRGLGLLSEVFGPAFVEQDTATRLFLYRGDMEREWASYGPEARMAATQFTSGINAYVDWLAQHPERLPEEFLRIGYRPSHWQPEDVVRIRSHGLTRNVGSEIARAWVSCVANPRTDEVRVPLEPPWHTTVPEGLEPCTIPDDVLHMFELAQRHVTFTRGALRGTAPARAHEEGDETTEGSNNWVIAPARTSTGRPILANDPHRGYGAPSLRYLVHLSAPGLDVVGAGEPAQPGISIGHNGTVAFGLTIFPIDQEDLYVYDLDPKDPGRYRYGDGWEPFRRLTEPVPIAGTSPKSVELVFTRHGPVLKMDPAHHKAYALRTAWLEPGMAPYYGSLRLMRAHDFAEFKAAMRNWGAPTENQVYADTQGHIGWVPGGLAPKRRGYDGLMPVPGDGRYEWTGFYDGDDLPSAYDPPEGFLATANQMNLPPDFPYKEKKLGFEWSHPSRYERIVSVLSATPHASIDDSVRLQFDQLSPEAVRLVALLKRLPHVLAGHPAADMLRAWDGVEHVDSGAAALFEVWRTRHLGPAFVPVATPAMASRVGQPDTRVLVETLEHPEPSFGVRVRDGLLENTLREAYADTMKLLGSNPAGWTWGHLQHARFRHPLEPAVSEATRRRLTVGDLPRGGSELSVNASLFSTGTFESLSGASVRIVLDVGNWDASRAINTPGQSGQPSSVHYRDLADAWSKGETFPLLYSRPAIEQNAERRIMLLPKS